MVPRRSSTFLALLDHTKPLQDKLPAIHAQPASSASVPLSVQSLAQPVTIAKKAMPVTQKQPRTSLSSAQLVPMEVQLAYRKHQVPT